MRLVGCWWWWKLRTSLALKVLRIQERKIAFLGRREGASLGHHELQGFTWCHGVCPDGLMRHYLINSPIVSLFYMNTWWAFAVRKSLLPPPGDTDEPAPVLMMLWRVNMNTDKRSSATNRGQRQQIVQYYIKNFKAKTGFGSYENRCYKYYIN